MTNKVAIFEKNGIAASISVASSCCLIETAKKIVPKGEDFFIVDSVQAPDNEDISIPVVELQLSDYGVIVGETTPSGKGK